MTSQEEERARVLAAFTDDLLADREPSMPPEAAALFTPEELAEALSTIRFLKGLLRPSRLDPSVEGRLRARLVERVRAVPAAATVPAPPMALPALLAERRHAASLSVAAVAVRAGLSERELEGLEADRIPFSTVPPERLLDIATALAIPLRRLLQATQLAAENWLPRLGRGGLQPELTGFQATTGMAMAANREAVRREAAETLANYLAKLERLARERGLD